MRNKHARLECAQYTHTHIYIHIHVQRSLKSENFFASHQMIQFERNDTQCAMYIAHKQINIRIFRGYKTEPNQKTTNSAQQQQRKKKRIKVHKKH